MNYEKDTKLAYDANKADSYNKDQTQGISWIRFTTAREQYLVKKALGQCDLSHKDKLIDIPCGTGSMGKLLTEQKAQILASDISQDMLELAKGEYNNGNFKGFVQADITKTPFKHQGFSCVVTIGLMHRLPLEIRLPTLQNITRLSNKFIIVSYSIDNNLQRFKQWILKKIRSGHKPAPSPITIETVMKELKNSNLKIKKKFVIMPFLCSEIIFLLEKE